MNSLFDNCGVSHRLARPEHPESSHESAVAIAPHLGARQQAALNAVRDTPGLTGAELEERHKSKDHRHLARRLPELRTMGLVRNGDNRPCEISGRTAQTWHLVENKR